MSAHAHFFLFFYFFGTLDISGIHSLFPHGENSRGLDQDPIRGPGQGPGPDLDTCPGHGPVFVAGIKTLAFH